VVTLSRRCVANPSILDHRSIYQDRRGTALVIERLASGKRINAAKDDAARRAIAGHLEKQVKGVTQSVTDLSDTTIVLQVARHPLKPRYTVYLRELAAQAANGSYSDGGR
jgi:flagellin